MRVCSQEGKLLILGLFFTAFSAQAGFSEYLRGGARSGADTSCATIILDGPALPPVRSQTNSQWCYAFLSADLLSWELGRPVSAADVALLYNDIHYKRAQKGLPHSEVQDGGNLVPAMEYVLQKGACLESDMPSEGFLVRRSATEGEDLRLVSLLRELEEYKQKFDTTKLSCPQCANRLDPFKMDVFRSFFPNLDANQIGEILSRADAVLFLSELQNRNCVRKPMPALQVRAVRACPGQEYSPEGQAALVARINERLDARKPVGLSVTADLVGLPRDFGKGELSTVTGQPSRHAAMHAIGVFGRQKNPRTGQCEYRLRDSDPGNCKRAGDRCDKDGYWWATAAQLEGKVEELTYLEPKGTSVPRPYCGR